MKCSIALLACGLASAYDYFDYTLESNPVPERFPRNHGTSDTLENKEFLQIVRHHPATPSIVDTLAHYEISALDKAVVTVTENAEAAAREANALTNADTVIRKNALNFWRRKTEIDAGRWCRPNRSIYCGVIFRGLAVNYIDHMFCANYPMESRREICMPESRIDYNNARFFNPY